MNLTKLTLFLLAYILISCQDANNHLYDELETLIAQRADYTNEKKQRLEGKKRVLSSHKDTEEHYRLCSDLADEYMLFNADSAYRYIGIALQDARRLNHHDHINRCIIRQAYVLATAGRYNEAETMVMGIPVSELNHKDSVAYYETCRWTYNVWEAYTNDNIYAQKGQEYLDTLISIVPANTADGLYFRAERQWAMGNLKQAEDLYIKCIGLLKDTERRYASATCALAMVYKQQGRLDDFEHYILLAAISDHKVPLKENLAMQELAQFMSQERHDFHRAQRYLVYAVEDAIFYNNKLRLTEIARKLPDIAVGYQHAEEYVRGKQIVIITVISLLAIGLLVTLCHIFRQNKDLKSQRKMRIALNEKLKATNKSREQYVSLFIELCAAYIDKYNKLQKTIERKVKAHQVDDLLALLHSSRVKDSDTKEFFMNFDRAFLTLYPLFVEEFNKLLSPEHHLRLKQGQLLNPELRIMALVRLGVKDTAKIATLLLYSPQTIYNYRSTLRSHALDKERFEENVAQLCEVN